MNHSNSNSNIRSLRDSLRNNIPGLNRRGLANNNNNNNKNSTSSSSDDDLFSKSSCLSLPDDDVKLGRLSMGGSKHKIIIDDFLSSHQGGGKHDYDWLLTPPGTPSVADNGNHHHHSNSNSIAPPRRSFSTTKPSSSSRFSVSHSETNNHVSKRTPRPSLSTSQYTPTTYSNNKSTNILNTSSASVSSYIRPSTPTRSRSSISRSTTPSRPRPSSPMDNNNNNNKPRPSHNSRPSTPTSRSQNLNSPPIRVTTPTRRTTTPSLSPVPSGRSLPNARNSVSRPSSPSPRLRSSGHPIVHPDFPLDTPPNLRTTLPDRPMSACRSRPGAKGNVESMMMANNNPSGSVSARGRQSSPVVSRGRLSESAGRGHRTLAPANENMGDAALDSRRELLTRKSSKTSPDATGFGRTISKKSLDMAIKHMDIRSGSNVSRPLTGSNLFPQSIRSSNQRSQPGSVSVNRNHLSIGAVAENGNHINARFYEIGSEENRNQSSAKLSNIDIYESSRYDMILLKEDLTNTNWLHSLDDKTDQGPIFDNGFELLPEPFDPL